jgi:hypothetical protein
MNYTEYMSMFTTSNKILKCSVRIFRIPCTSGIGNCKLKNQLKYTEVQGPHRAAPW